MTARQVVPLSAATVDLLREPCRGCVRWHRDPVEAHAGRRRSITEQREWVGALTSTWGPPGVMLRQDDRTLAHAVVSPPSLVARSELPATSPVSDDAVLLLSLSSESRAYTRQVVQVLSRELVHRRVRAVEAYAGPPVVAGCLSHPQSPLAGPETPWPAPEVCRVPVKLLTDLGFVVVREHPVVPRLRLDLRSAAIVVEDVTAAVRRLLPDRTTVPAAT